jgi:hypothetical protein
MFLCTVIGLPAAQIQTYTTSWVGNTFNGLKWVQGSINAMFVTPDGTIFCNARYEIAGREAGIYKEGDVIGVCEGLHGPGRSGGQAVVADDKYIYLAMSQVGDATGDNWKTNIMGWPKAPAKDKIWYGVRRYTRNGKPAVMPNGRGADASILLINETPLTEKAEVTGLAVDTKLSVLFVSDPVNGQIRLFNLTNGLPVTQWTIEQPGPLLSDRTGGVWVIHAPGTPPVARVIHLNAEGKKYKHEITSIPKASALAMDAWGKLAIADNGAKQQVFIYDVANEPKQVGVLGEEGGITKGVRGQVTNLRFENIVGIGYEQKGNIYVACAGPGTVIRKHYRDGASPWELTSLIAGETLDADLAGDGKDVFSVEERFTMDFAQPIGRIWKWTAMTRDPLLYPHDPRLHTRQITPLVRMVSGIKCLFTTDTLGSMLCLYRFEGETAVPTAIFTRGHVQTPDNWPPLQPEKGAWQWLDANGDGQIQTEEYNASATNEPPGYAWCVDSKGDVWMGSELAGVKYYRCQGLTPRGIPTYGSNKVEVVAKPEMFSSIQRMEYVAEHGIMYLGGYSKDKALHSETTMLGNQLARYDKWPDKPEMRWRVALEMDPPRAFYPKSMCVAGGLVFVVYTRLGEVRAFDGETGKFVGVLRPGPEVNNDCGWVLATHAVRAFQRTDGEYVVFVADSLKSKTIMYRFKMK